MSQPGSAQWLREDAVLHQMNVHVDHLVDLTAKLAYHMEHAFATDHVAPVETVLLDVSSEVMGAIAQVKEWNVMHEDAL